MSPRFHPGRQVVLAAGLISAITLMVFAPVAGNRFISFDDDSYIYQNPQVRRGLTSATILWAFTSTEHANWYPLRRLSHLVDVSLFGMWAGGHHMVSAAWHAAAAALLFLALRRITGAPWRSLMVSGLFTAHPLQVESVAWAAERSNVQAGFFFALSLLFWARYVRRPVGGRYVAALAACALGLVAKPTAVPLPLLLLLLDFWPLGRLGSAGNAPWEPSGRALGRLLLEKVPLVVLAAATSSIAIYAHRRAGWLESMEALPFPVRLGDALLSCWRYLGKLFWPMNLAVSYVPTGRDLGLGLATAAGLGLIALTALVFVRSRRSPWLALGWLWYLGMLVPTLGLVRFGGQSMSDRFAYLPMVGIFIIVAWGFPASFRTRRHCVALAAVVLVSFAAAARCQVGYWRDTFTLFEHAYRINPNNPLAMKYYGLGLASRGRREEGYALVKRAQALNPNLRTETLIRMATMFEQQGRINEAARSYLEALGVSPSNILAKEGLERLRRQSAADVESK